MRILFVGTLQLRKGVQYLLEAKRLLKTRAVTIRLVGPSRLSECAMRELGREMEIIGPVPRAEMNAHYAWADVFVLPTLSEGSANVVYEAMAAGLPVITTPNAGSVIRDGKSGMLVNIRDAAVLARTIEVLASNSRLRDCFIKEALMVLHRYDRADYGERLRSTLTTHQQASA